MHEDVSLGWTVVILATLSLGVVTVAARRRRLFLSAYIPIVLTTVAILMTPSSGGLSALIADPVLVPIGLLGLAPPSVLAFLASLLALRSRVPDWLLFTAPVLGCLVGAVFVFPALLWATCSLTGDCL